MSNVFEKHLSTKNHPSVVLVDAHSLAALPTAELELLEDIADFRVLVIVGLSLITSGLCVSSTYFTQEILLSQLMLAASSTALILGLGLALRDSFAIGIHCAVRRGFLKATGDYPETRPPFLTRLLHGRRFSRGIRFVH